MSGLDDGVAFQVGRMIGGNIRANQEQGRLHRELIDTITDATAASRSGQTLDEYRRRKRAEDCRCMATARENQQRRCARQAAFYRKAKSFLLHDIVVVGLNTEYADCFTGKKQYLGWATESLPAIGTRIMADKPFMRCVVCGCQLDISIPFNGFVNKRNQWAVDNKVTGGAWLLKIRLADTSRELKVCCPFCDGHISFVVAECGGRTIACPHCAKEILLPNE